MQHPETKLTATERRLEQIHGRPMRDLLAAAVNEHGTIRGTAQALGLSETTLTTYLERWGVEIRRVAYVPAAAAP